MRARDKHRTNHARRLTGVEGKPNWLKTANCLSSDALATLAGKLKKRPLRKTSGPVFAHIELTIDPFGNLRLTNPVDQQQQTKTRHQRPETSDQ
jgi:hypothetical protein